MAYYLYCFVLLQLNRPMLSFLSCSATVCVWCGVEAGSSWRGWCGGTVHACVGKRYATINWRGETYNYGIFFSLLPCWSAAQGCLGVAPPGNSKQKITFIFWQNGKMILTKILFFYRYYVCNFLKTNLNGQNRIAPMARATPHQI
jgi:hypothetical protein